MALIHNTNCMLLIMNILREKENVIYNTCDFLTLQKHSSTDHITSLNACFKVFILFQIKLKKND